MAGQSLQENLNRSALIIRKYNLGSKEYYFEKFAEFNKSQLEAGWTFAIQKIQNREIIKDTSTSLNSEDTIGVSSTINSLTGDTNKTYRFLNSNFDVKSLKLRDENIQRRVRHILADKWLSQILIDTKKQNLEKQNSPLAKFSKVLSKYKIAIGVFLVVGAFSTPRIIDGLTLPENLLNKYLHDEYSSIKSSSINVDVLTNYLHEDSKYKFNGAICNDGWTSHSQGRGTCSHHHGVDYYFYEGDYSKTIEQCRQDAIKAIEELRKKALKKSWRD